jgi:hypothetical protein
VRELRQVRELRELIRLTLFSRNANGVRGRYPTRSHDVPLAHAVGVAAKRFLRVGEIAP